MQSAAAGYGTTWYQHTWRVKCTPIIDTQEYQDILQNPAGQADTEQIWQNSLGATSADGTGAGVQNNSGYRHHSCHVCFSVSKRFTDNNLTNAAAKAAVNKRAYFIQHLYVRPVNES